MGGFMAGKLSQKVAVIECMVALMGHISDRMRYLSPSVYGLLEHLEGVEQFAELECIRRCGVLVQQGRTFPEGWKQAVRESEKALGRQEAELLAGLGDVLGSADLDSQLAAIQHTKTCMQARLEQARNQEQKYGRLYRTLGVLGGLGAAIILM